MERQSPSPQLADPVAQGDLAIRFDRTQDAAQAQFRVAGGGDPVLGGFAIADLPLHAAVVERIRQWNTFIRLPLKAGYDKDGIMTLEFASMAEARAAWEVVDRDYSFFQGVSKGFVADPCELPAEENLINETTSAPTADDQAVSDEDQRDSDLD